MEIEVLRAITKVTETPPIQKASVYCMGKTAIRDRGMRSDFRRPVSRGFLYGGRQALPVSTQDHQIVKGR